MILNNWILPIIYFSSLYNFQILYYEITSSESYATQQIEFLLSIGSISRKICLSWALILRLYKLKARL